MFSHFSAGMLDNLSTGISVGGKNRLVLHSCPYMYKYPTPTYIIITSDGISFQVNPL